MPRRFTGLVLVKRSAARSSSCKASRTRVSKESVPGSRAATCCAATLIISGARSATRSNCPPNAIAAAAMPIITSTRVSTVASARLRTRWVSATFKGITSIANIRPADSGTRKRCPHQSAAITASVASTELAALDRGSASSSSGA